MSGLRLGDARRRWADFATSLRGGFMGIFYADLKQIPPGLPGPACLGRTRHHCYRLPSSSSSSFAPYRYGKFAHEIDRVDTTRSHASSHGVRALAGPVRLVSAFATGLSCAASERY